MLSWKARPAVDGIVVAPDGRLPWPQTIALGVQHVIAMFGGTVLVPLVAAIALILGTGDFTLKFGDFAMGGIGTRPSA